MSDLWKKTMASIIQEVIQFSGACKQFFTPIVSRYNFPMLYYLNFIKLYLKIRGLTKNKKSLLVFAIYANATFIIGYACVFQSEMPQGDAAISFRTGSEFFLSSQNLSHNLTFSPLTTIVQIAPTIRTVCALEYIKTKCAEDVWRRWIYNFHHRPSSHSDTCYLFKRLTFLNSIISIVTLPMWNCHSYNFTYLHRHCKILVDPMEFFHLCAENWRNIQMRLL